METHSSFLERQRELLLRYLDGIAPQGIEPNAKEFCDRVLDDWHQRYDAVALDTPEPVERTFWCALYLLEEMVEYAAASIGPIDIYHLKSLAQLRELLRSGSELPDGWYATRPDGT